MSAYVAPLLRTRTQLIKDIEHRMRDRGNRRWKDEEIIRALNDSIALWQGRVSVPYVYTITGGWVSGTYEYSLPDYMGRRIRPQRRVLSPYIDTTTSTTQYVWADVRGWDLDPDGSGGQTLRTQWNEGTPGTTSDARILWWAANGYLPETASVPALNANIDSDDTSLVLDAVYDVGRVGYVKVNAEWIQYAGVTDDGSNTTLGNLVRGVGSTAASHSSGDSVEFGMAAPETRLWTQLQDQARALLHSLSLSEGPGQEMDHHRWAMQWHQQRADDFWKSYTPDVRPRLRLSRRATGWE